MSKPLVLPEGTYMCIAEMGYCRVCSAYRDLRCGACFDCSGKVSGKPIAGGHELWETANPDNRWKVQAS